MSEEKDIIEALRDRAKGITWHWENSEEMAGNTADEIASLRSRVAALEEALKPFSAAFDHLPVEDKLVLAQQCIWGTDAAQHIKVSDLRRARSALNAASGGERTAPEASGGTMQHRTRFRQS